MREHKPGPKLKDHAPHIIQPIGETAHDLFQQLLTIRAVFDKRELCITRELIEERFQFALFRG
jgi:hypothetical protein